MSLVNSLDSLKPAIYYVYNTVRIFVFYVTYLSMITDAPQEVMIWSILEFDSS